MSHRIRTATALLAVVAGAALLTSCSLLASGPPRGDDGQVLEAAVVPATALLTGDCFSWAAEYPNHERVNLVPCSDEHGYIVIGQGSLTERAIDAAGGLQNAVSAECKEPFATFKASVAEGVKPTQEFLVTQSEVDGDTITNFSCVATDGAVQAAN